MDYLKGQLENQGCKKISNSTTKNKMEAEQRILDRIQRNQVEWYSRLLRMDDIR